MFKHYYLEIAAAEDEDLPQELVDEHARKYRHQNANDGQAEYCPQAGVQGTVNDVTRRDFGKNVA